MPNDYDDDYYYFRFNNQNEYFELLENEGLPLYPSPI